MPTQMFVNLPVKDLKRSIEFFTALGFSFNPQFTDDTATCMIVEDGANYVMLLTEEKFKTFSPLPIADGKAVKEVLVTLSRDSREAVDEIVKKAVDAGGTTYKEPQDYGFMYGHGFQDPDGHVWELMYMDMSQFPTA